MNKNVIESASGKIGSNNAKNQNFLELLSGENIFPPPKPMAACVKIVGKDNSFVLFLINYIKIQYKFRQTKNIISFLFTIFSVRFKYQFRGKKI